MIHFGGRDSGGRHFGDCLRNRLRHVLHMNRGRLDHPLLHTTRGNSLGCAIGNNAIGHHTLDQPVTFTQARRTIVNTTRAQVIVSVLANTAVIVFICNRAATVVTINAEHPTRGVVGDDREAELVLFHLEVSVARLADRQRQLGGSAGTGGDGSSFRSGRESFRACNGDGGAENGFEIAVSRREHVVGRLRRNGGVGGRRREIDRAGLDTKLGFGLSSSEELLVDNGVVAVKLDVGAGAVGIAFEDDVNIRRHAEENAELNPTYQLVNKNSRD